MATWTKHRVNTLEPGQSLLQYYVSMDNCACVHVSKCTCMYYVSIKKDFIIDLCYLSIKQPGLTLSIQKFYIGPTDIYLYVLFYVYIQVFINVCTIAHSITCIYIYAYIYAYTHACVYSYSWVCITHEYRCTIYAGQPHSWQISILLLFKMSTLTHLHV